MKKLLLISATIFLFFSANVFAEAHLDEAIKHATAAAQAGDSAGLLEHARPALEHATAGALVARGVARSHADEGVKAIEDSIAKSKAKKSAEASASMKAALEHLKAANKK